MKQTYLVLSIIFILILFAGCVQSSKTVDQKTVPHQIVKNKIHVPLIFGYDCTIVLSDYSLHRVWYPTQRELDTACYEIPVNTSITLTLTKYTDSENRYDVTGYSKEWP